MNYVKVLFVIKERHVYGTKYASYGLTNSCEFIVNALKNSGIDAKVSQVVDSNSIDRELYIYRPTHCFIEALWVTPDKIVELSKKHPRVKWIIRIHSMIPFLTSEGMAFDWLNEYQQLRHKCGINISISCNNIELFKDLKSIYRNISYTPNIYKPNYSKIGNIPLVIKNSKIINIGCFGALRVLKNQAQQAFYAIQFTEKIGKVLHFHINTSGHGLNQSEPILKNLRNIFKHSKHRLIEHTWMPHEDFIELVKKMDFGLQLSFTETFNIVCANFVDNGIPIVVSDAIKFVNPFCTVNLSNRCKILFAMYVAYYGKKLKINKWDKYLLEKHNKTAIKEWLNFLK